MPAKRPAPKSAKGKKVLARPAPRKSIARKPEAPRARPLAARKSVPAARKPTTPALAAQDIELKKPLPRPPSPPNVATATRQTAAPAGTEADDGDSLEPGSLLAGPRNVQPYIVKRGEQYMSKEQLEHFRTILNSWKRDLMVEVDRTVSHMKDEAANFPDPNDRATQEEEFSLELRTRDRERKLIRKIDEALHRIEDGSYGYCLETGEEIGIKRLEARPVATLSIEAQERRERRERQYGDRDDRYR
jgi:DnaK suppressor protein